MIIVEYLDVKSFIDAQGLKYPKALMTKDLDTEDQWYDRNGRKRSEAIIQGSLGASFQGEHCIDLGTSVGYSATQFALNIYPGVVWTVNILPEQLSKDMRAITHVLSREDIGRVHRENKCENVIQVYSDTQKWKTPEALKDVAFVLVDACHDRGYVCRDSLKYWPLIRVGGYILWHDFNPVLRNDYRTSWINEAMSGAEDFIDEMGLQDNPIYHVKDTWVGLMRKEE